LGISDGKEGSACLVDDGKIIYAVDEERLSRVKMQSGFPQNSVERILGEHKDIDAVAVGGILTPFVLTRMLRRLQKMESKVLAGKKNSKSFVSDFIKFKLKWSLIKPDSVWSVAQKPFIIRFLRRDLPERLRRKPLTIVDHHLAHASSAYFTSGKKKVLCITADGYGDGVSLTINACENGNIKRVYETGAWDSFGLFYGLITLMLGFKSHMHEGKITGLAAYGNAENVNMKFPLVSRGRRICYLGEWGRKGVEKFAEELRENSREDIAAWLQKNLENEICRLAKKWINETGIRDVVLAGGVFANVKLNQRICELPEVKSVYIFPDMGDGGLSVGAAMYVWSKRINKQRNEIRYQNLNHVYLGQEYSNKEIETELVKHGLEYKFYMEIEPVIAKSLSQGKTVARFKGKMEFGPRALGNRSILYQATDPAVNDWLNRKLRRTEFMPFAPSTLLEYAGLCYENYKKAVHAAHFMTVTFRCTDWMKKKCPGAVHVDGTARPQLVNKKFNPSFYSMIDAYRKVTGIPTVINTSFNMHEEPIVENPDDAIMAFVSAKLDYLAIGNYLVKGE
jgi:carbamoyltransferase